MRAIIADAANLVTFDPKSHVPHINLNCHDLSVALLAGQKSHACALSNHEGPPLQPVISPLLPQLVKQW